MFKEFREFAMKGNVLDLAIGVIIGAAFGKIVTSLVEDVIMPPIGYVLGKLDFSSLFVSLDGKHYATLMEAKKAAAPVIGYGSFLNTVINFTIVAFSVFLMVRAINKVRRAMEKKAAEEPAVPAPPSPEEALLTEIRDILKGGPNEGDVAS